jgi:LysM repeat protein
MRTLIISFIIILALLIIGGCIGWYLKPCGTDVIYIKGDTTFIQPKPERLIRWDYRSLKPKTGLFASITGHKGEHKVREGENLYRIGLKYGLTAEELRLANRLASYDIKAGEWLKIPSKTIRDSVYQYEKEFGDSVVKGRVFTQSFGPILSQTVEWQAGMPKRRAELYLGASLDDMMGISAIGAVQLNDKWLLTTQYGINYKNLQLGVLKRIR